MDGSHVPAGLGETAAAFLSAPHLNLIGEHWVASRSGETLPVIDPGTGARLSTIQASGAADVDQAVAAARGALEHGPWGRMSAPDRGRLLTRLAQRLGDAAEELAKLESLDTAGRFTSARSSMFQAR